MDLVERLAQRINLNADIPPGQPAPGTTGGAAYERRDIFTREPFLSRVSIPLNAIPDEVAPAETHPGSSVPNRPELETSPANRRQAEQIELNLEEITKRGYLTPESPHSLLAEEYRIIKRPLLRQAFANTDYGKEREHVALITSARPGEGKTFTAINLGMSIASEPDCHVLLVDADVRQRGLSRAFGVGERIGLTNVINDPSLSLADAILATNIPNLSILPAGKSTLAPTEMLASQRAKDVFAEMTQRYSDRFIILDSPPVLASSEPGVLAGYAGQVIMIALAGETPKQAIAESLVLLDTPLRINFILNKVTLLAGSGRFGYYGYYGEN